MEVRSVANTGIIFGLNQISRDVNTNVRSITMNTLNDASVGVAAVVEAPAAHHAGNAAVSTLISVGAAAAALHEENTMTVIIMGGNSVASMGVFLRPTEV